MSDRIERMREKQRQFALKMGKTPDAPAPFANLTPEPEPPPPAKKEKPKKEPRPTLPPKEMITHVCGHQTPSKAFESSYCQACQIANRERRRKQWDSKTQARRAASVKNAGRLPDGSVFHVEYHAETTSWEGTLTIPGHEPIQSKADAVFHLLASLDNLYRNSLASNGQGT